MDDCNFQTIKTTLGISHTICTNEEVRRKYLSEREFSEDIVLNCDDNLCLRMSEEEK